MVWEFRQSPFGSAAAFQFQTILVANSAKSMTTSNETSSGDLRLGTLLGRRQAFSTIAARCSAADAGALRQIRDQKDYIALELTFAEFCSRRIGISATHANRLIRYLDEFGPEYFELAQLTGISPAEYRAIAPAVKDQAVHCGERVIPLLPENTEQLAAAVAELRAAAPQREELSVDLNFERLERKAGRLVEEFRTLYRNTADAGDRLRLATILGTAHDRLQRLELELGYLR
jgi:hypothetical protein